MDAGIVKQFQDRQIRSAWNAEEEQWYFSVIDVVGALTDSSDPRQYVKRMRSRDSELNANWGTICTPVRMAAADGKNREIRNMCAAVGLTVERLLRIRQGELELGDLPAGRWRYLRPEEIRYLLES